MKLLKTIISTVLVAAIMLAAVVTTPAIVVQAGNGTERGLTAATMPTGKNLSIFLKDESQSTELRQTIYRWNVNGSGGGRQAVIHLDDANGDNCEMQLTSCKVDGVQYYAIKHTDSKYYIDTEGNNSKTGEVLHQYHDSIKQDNQKFRFVPVPGEKDTYYIMTRNGDKSGKSLYVGTKDNKIDKHTKLVTTTTPTKWIVSLGDKAYATGEEVTLPEYTSSENSTEKDYMVFTLSPEGSIYDVNVKNDSVPVDGCDLHLYFTGTSSKIKAEYVQSQDAYRLRSLNLDENKLSAIDYVWDIDGASLSAGEKAHIWSKKGEDHKSQFWRFIPVAGKQDVYYIYNCNSKLYLSLEKTEANANGIKVIQDTKPIEWKMTVLNKTDHDTPAKNWMSAIPDDTPLSEINIPGTHDAGAANMYADVQEQQSAGRAQQLYLNEQLNVGVRAWDIRIDATDSSDNPDIIHGFSWTQCQNAEDNNLTLKEVMDTAKEFLEKYPTETIIMTIKEDGKVLKQDNIAPAALEKYINNTNGTYPIWKGNDAENPDYIPTLGEVRGKIVILRRYGMEDYTTTTNKTYFGLDASKWDNFDYTNKDKPYNKIYDDTPDDISTNKAAYQLYNQIWVQDNYSESNADFKLQSFNNTIDYATTNKITHNITVTDDDKTIENRAYLFNYSGAKDNLSQPREINEALLKNDKLNQPDSEENKKTIGIVMTNYIDSRLAERIYKTNFAVNRSQVSFPRTATLTYGQSLSEAVFEGGSGDGIFRFRNGKDIPNAGTFSEETELSYVVEFIPDDVNSEIITEVVALVVSKKALNFKANNLTITYGENTPHVSEFFEGANRFKNLKSFIELKDKNGNIVASDEPLAVGEYDVVVKIDNPNYELEKATGATLTVEANTDEDIGSGYSVTKVITVALCAMISSFICGTILIKRRKIKLQ